MFMVEIIFVNFKVRCPRDAGAIREMQMRFAMHDTQLIPAPCGGCDELQGGKICYQCAAAITKMFAENPKLDVCEPLVVNLQG